MRLRFKNKIGSANFILNYLDMNNFVVPRDGIVTDINGNPITKAQFILACRMEQLEEYILESVHP